MAGISTARKIGIVARVAARQAGRNRRLGALAQAARVTGKHFSRVLHLLWLEVTGFVFLSFAVIGGVALARQFPKYQAGKIGPGPIVAAVVFMIVFAYFGVSSFWRVRKKKS